MRNENRIHLRPEVITCPTCTGMEAFQNDTIRPVLKLQNDHLQLLVTSYLHKKRVAINSIATTRRRAKLQEMITRDSRLRNLLFGSIVGMFVEDELEYYLANEKEANRRITNLLIGRLAELN